MQEKILGWSINEVAELVDAINSKKETNLLPIFGNFASHHKRNIYSVRNFYYRLIREAKCNNSVREILTKYDIKLGYTSHFCEREETALLKSILLDNGKSVRATCFMLAGGDKTMAIRYQNKYRNTLKNKPDFVKKLTAEITASGQKSRLNLGGKILTIPSQKTDRNYLSEKEIQSLFLGLVRLVKRSAEQELEDKQNYQLKLDNSRLMDVAIDNRKKSVLINELKAQNKILQSRLDLAIKKQQESEFEYQKISELLHENKMEKLREFVSKLSDFKQKTSKKR